MFFHSAYNPRSGCTRTCCNAIPRELLTKDLSVRPYHLVCRPLLYSFRRRIRGRMVAAFFRVRSTAAVLQLHTELRFRISVSCSSTTPQGASHVGQNAQTESQEGQNRLPKMQGAESQGELPRFSVYSSGRSLGATSTRSDIILTLFFNSPHSRFLS